MRRNNIFNKIPYDSIQEYATTKSEILLNQFACGIKNPKIGKYGHVVKVEHRYELNSYIDQKLLKLTSYISEQPGETLTNNGKDPDIYSYEYDELMQIATKTEKDYEGIILASVETHDCGKTIQCTDCKGSKQCSKCNGEKKIICPICEGTGECKSCEGTGYNDCHNCSTTGTCPDCNGAGKVDCRDCDGSGECSTCDGTGDEVCDDCYGTGEYRCPSCGGSGLYRSNIECRRCNGHGYIECKRCNGTGHYTCSDCDGEGECTTCNGRGDFWCKTCNKNGKCRNCHGRGEIACHTCHGSKGCTTCHGKKEVECDVCLGIGTCTSCQGTGIMECPRCKGLGSYQTYTSYKIESKTIQATYESNSILGYSLSSFKGMEVYSDVFYRRNKKNSISDSTDKMIDSLKENGEKFAKWLNLQKNWDTFEPYQLSAKHISVPIITIFYEFNDKTYLFHIAGTEKSCVYNAIPSQGEFFKMEVKSFFNNIFSNKKQKKNYQ